MAAIPVRMYARYLYLKARRDYDSPTMTLEQAQHQLLQWEEVEEEEDWLSISQLPTTEDRLEHAESIISLATVDPKGKAPEAPSSKPTKRKLAKASEREPKRIKAYGLCHVCSQTIEVCH